MQKEMTRMSELLLVKPKMPVEGVEATGAAAPQVEHPTKQEVSFDM